MTIQRTPMLDETFGREYDAAPEPKRFTREEYIARRYAIAGRNVIPAHWCPRSSFDWTGK